jgi:hypothetical protein
MADRSKEDARSRAGPPTSGCNASDSRLHDCNGWTDSNGSLYAFRIEHPAEAVAARSSGTSRPLSAARRSLAAVTRMAGPFRNPPDA